MIENEDVIGKYSFQVYLSSQRPPLLLLSLQRNDSLKCQLVEKVDIFFVPLPSRAISHARGHLRISRFARRTTEKRGAARSLDVP